MSESGWQPGEIAALLGNPVYAVQIHGSFRRPHRRFLSEERWVSSNAHAVGELGPAPWLRLLLTALQADHGRDGDHSRPNIADPFSAVLVHPALCHEYPPLVEEELWIAANVVGLENNEEMWLRNLLSVLKGACVGVIAMEPDL